MESNRKNPRRKAKKGKMNWAQRRMKAKANKELSRNADYQKTEYKLVNVKFDLYYRRLLDPILDAGNATTPQEAEENKNQDFKAFLHQLKQKLPITFRVNPLNVGFETITDLFSSETFVKDWCEKHKENPDFQAKEGRISNLSQEVLDSLRFTNLEFYPEKLLYQIPLSREVLRKDHVLSSVHKFIQLCNDSGLLTRQEVVSMIPPLLLDVKPGYKIFDACAAPGSKTAQLLEFSLRGLTGKDIMLNPGFVIANDADESRANLLAHQMSRFNYGWIVNHDAQNFPTLHYQPGTEAYSSLDKMNFDSRVFFDRIICDVPCSSDAAIRKIPKKWDTWDPNDGACLHPLQLKILIRSLLMLRPNSEDSYLTYSTCSLNPIENEAVVHAALKKLNEDSGFTEFELVDCRNKLLPFRTREGLTKWAVFDAYSKHRRKRSQKERQKLREMKEAKGRGEGEQDDEGEQVDEEQEEKNEEKDCEGDREKNEEEAKEEGKEEEGVYVFEEYFREYKGLEDVPSERQNRFIATNFPPEGTEDEIEEKYHLKRCVRVFPNDQDTSGFFIVLFKRNPNPGLTSNPIQTDEAKEKLKEETKDNQGMLQETIVPVQKTLKNMMRCDPKDPDIEFIVTYYGLSPDFPVDQIFTYSETMNKLVVVNRGLSDVLYADQNKQLSLIAAGAEAFIRNTSKTYSGTECIFRISQNGVNHIYPFMTKRLVYTDLETFLLVVNKKRIELKDLPEGDFKDKVTSLSCGCFVCVTKVNEEQEEAIVLHRHFHHINTMISELNMHKIRTCLNKEF